MHRFSRSVARLAVIAGAAAVAVTALAGCGGTTTTTGGGPPPAARLERTGPHGALSVVLTSLGAQRAGIQTATAGPM